MPLRFDPGVEIVHDFVQDRTEGLALPVSCPISRRYVIFCAAGENHRHYENGTCNDLRFAFLPYHLAGTRDGRKQGENENVKQVLDRRLR